MSMIALNSRPQSRDAGSSLAALFDGLLHWLETARSRRDLAGLGDAALKDIGLSRADAEREARRPFWDQR